MKRKIIIASAVLMYGTSIGQIIPTAGGQGSNSIEYWSRSGNNPNGSNNNIFGTIWNSPIYTITGGITPANVRVKLNGDFIGMGQYSINGYGTPQGVNTTGYMGLGANTDMGGGQYLWSNMGPYSLLHLNGRNGTFVQAGGFRPWMQAGVTLTDNQDLSYMGLRRVGSVFDVTETVIAWADNSGGEVGPDDMVFRFTSGGGNNNITTDLQTSSDLDGRHIARFAGTGEFGLGNTFGTNPAGTPANLYVRPASLAHYSLSNLRSVWQQFTNRNVAMNTGTGENASDGLRIGIIGHTNVNVNGTAAVYNQEARALLFSTNVNTNSVNVLNGTTLERLRIMSVGTPTHLASGGFGVYNPGSIGTNMTRMAVSHDPSQPVTRPLSLLHLGYNTGLSSSPIGSTDGWRSWMDIGTFTSNGTDNMYVGLKNEGTDRFDAVVSWGDNQSAGLLTNEGPDNLRFIFTSTTSSVLNPGDSISMSANGLETGRFYPGYDTTFTYMLEDPLDLYGRFGVGDFTASGVNEHPTHKLDVIGNGRFRFLPDSLYMADSLVNKIVMVDSMGVLRWIDADSLSTGAGNYCGATANPLTGNYEIPLNDNNFFFSGNGGDQKNVVSIGLECSDPVIAKLNVMQEGYWRFYSITPTNNIDFSIAGAFSASYPDAYWGVGTLNVANTSGINYGVYGNASGGIQNWAGYFNGDVIATSYQYSDENLKENIQDYKNANELLSQLRPVSYHFRTNEYPQLNMDSRAQIGLISQEVEQVLPSAVKEATSMPKFNSEGEMEHEAVTFKSLSYEKFIPILIGGHQEQTSDIQTLKQENEELRNEVALLNEKIDQLINCLQNQFPDLCRIEQGMIQQNMNNKEQLRHIIDIELSKGTSIVLNQNVPNPFAESTVITYSIPESVKAAQIIFHDATGSLIKTVDIRERGNGQINVYAHDLSTGVYTYSLVADDKIVATKRMVKQ